MKEILAKSGDNGHAAIVSKQMQQRLNLSVYGKIFFHAGKNYRESLISQLRNWHRM